MTPTWICIVSLLQFSVLIAMNMDNDSVEFFFFEYFEYEINFRIFQAWDHSFERIESLNSSDTAFIIFNVQVQRADCSDFVVKGNITFKSAFTQNPSMFYVSGFGDVLFVVFFFCSESCILFISFWNWFQHTTHIYHKTLGGDQYDRLPVQFPRESFCSYVNNFYRRHFMNSLKQPVSNFPHTDDPNEDLCRAFQSENDVSNRFINLTLKNKQKIFIDNLWTFLFQLVFNIRKFLIDKSVVPSFVQEGMYKMEILIDSDDVVVAGVIIYLQSESESNS